MKKTLIAAGGSLLLLLGACSKDPDKTDFKKQTADFINGKEVAEKAGVDFNGAECDEPASTAVGTTYQCTATGRGRVELGVRRRDHLEERLHGAERQPGGCVDGVPPPCRRPAPPPPPA